MTRAPARLGIARLRRWQAARQQRSWRTLLVALVALVPRVLDLGRFVTVDEVNFWVRRSQTFLRAIETGDYAATAIAVHPGVTTMWLGAAGLALQRQLERWGFAFGDNYGLYLALLQLPVALTHTLAIVLGYWLLRRLLAPNTALLAALLWASDPFVVGYSRVLHVDALAGSFATLSLLAGLRYWDGRPSLRLLALSAACAALAALSKSPGALAGVVVLGGLLLYGRGQGSGVRDQAVGDQETSRQETSRQQTVDSRQQTADQEIATLSVIRRSSFVVRRSSFVVRPLSIFLWLLMAVVTALVAWPALWAAPGRVLELLGIGVTVQGGSPHELGNFFLGQAYADQAPGWLYYPVALALRTTPWALLGLLVLPLVLLRRLRRNRLSGNTGAMAMPMLVHRLAVLALFVVLFVLMMSLFPKKFDRYLVPVFPSLNMLAAVGLVGLVAWLKTEDGRRQTAVTRLTIFRPPSSVLRWAAVSLLCANLAWYHPYALDYYNPLLGGVPVGARSFQFGWGEGLEQAAAWLNAQPDITGVTVAAQRTESLQRYLRAGGQVVTPAASGFAADTGYVVVYLRDVQPGVALPPFDQYYPRAAPTHTIDINGVPAVWIYQVPPPVEQMRAAQFGEAIRLRGYTLNATSNRDELALKLVWASQATISLDYALFVHLIGPDGQRYAQADPLVPTSSWEPNRYYTTLVPLVLPGIRPAGVYQIVIGLYDAVTGERLVVAGDDTTAGDGARALVLTQVPLGEEEGR